MGGGKRSDARTGPRWRHASPRFTSGRLLASRKTAAPLLHGLPSLRQARDARFSTVPGKPRASSQAQPQSRLATDSPGSLYDEEMDLPGVQMGSKITEAQAAFAACVAINDGEPAVRAQAALRIWLPACLTRVADCAGRTRPPPSAIWPVAKGTLMADAFTVLSVIPRPDKGMRRPPGNTSGRFEFFCNTRTRIPGPWPVNCWMTPGTTGISLSASSGGWRRLPGMPGGRGPREHSGGFRGRKPELGAGGSRFNNGYSRNRFRAQEIYILWFGI